MLPRGLTPQHFQSALPAGPERERSGEGPPVHVDNVIGCLRTVCAIKNAAFKSMCQQEELYVKLDLTKTSTCPAHQYTLLLKIG